MRILHSKKQMLAFFLPGFLLGILYVNFIVKQYIAEPGIFSTYFLRQYAAVEIGRLLGKNVNTVCTLLARAKAMLKEQLGGEEFE